MSHSAAPPEPAVSSFPSPALHPVDGAHPARVPGAEAARLMADAGLRAAESGDRTLHEALELEHPEANLPLYLQAIDTLVRWQSATRPGVLPVQTPAALRQELDGFAQSYLRERRGLAIDATMDQRLATVFDHLVQYTLDWPQVVVHGNFTLRALCPSAGHTPSTLGILDLQDAHQGPITHDIATLVRDIAPAWDEAFVLDVTVRYWQTARAAGLPVGEDFGAFYQAAEWMALLRHLQMLGAYAQRCRHDGDADADGQAETTHRIHQVRAIASRYGALKPLLRAVDAAEGIVDASGYAFGRV